MRKTLRPYVTIKHGKPYFRRTWLDADGKRKEQYIPLPADLDSAKFDRAYWAVRSGTAEAVQPKASHTWRELILTYKASARYKKLAEGTRKEYDRVIGNILEKNADKSVRDMTRKGVLAIHAKYAETPRKADWQIQVIRMLLNFAIRRMGWRIENVADGVELYGKQREYEPWPQWMIDKLPDAPERVRTAAELILGTGQRPSAAITMRRDQFNGEWMTVVDEKNDEPYEVYCPNELRQYVERLPVNGAFLLAKNLTQPLGYNLIEKAFSRWRDSLGPKAKQFSLHGLRKLAIIRLAEAGCSDAEIQAITNQSAEMVAYYRRRANRRVLSKQAAERTKHET